MSVSVTMPQLGESVTEGTITRWLKKEGDDVAADEPLLEVSTDKVDTEIPAPSSGVLLRILAQEDDTVAVGAELAVIGAPNEAPLQPHPTPDAAAPVEPAPVETAPVETSPVETAPVETAPVETVEPAAGPATTERSTPGGADTSVTMPALGESVTEGTVTRWLKAVGDAVAADEPLLEVSTDKVDTEIPSPVAGTLSAITVAEDQTVDVGAELGVISATASPSPAAAAPTLTAPSAPAPTAPVTVPPAAAAAAPTAPTAAAGEPDASTGYVTPLVRKLAAEYGVDLATVTGTGVGGRIRKDDVLQAAKLVAQQAQAKAAPAAGPATGSAAGTFTATGTRTEKMSRLRKVIATRMVESLQTSAQLTTVVEVDVTRVAALRQRAKRDFEEREGVKLSFLPFFAKATVEALKQFPVVNATIDTEAGTVTYHDAENLGIAVDTERGLLVPVIHQAGDLNVAGLAKRIADLANRTRAGKITPDELAGGTFTLTNTGSRGALFDTPIINQPEVGIIGTGSVVKRPVVVSDDTGGDVIAIRSMVFLALTYDHRLVDGAEAARFLVAVKDRLEEAAFESDLGL
ncbi:MAG: 2-oxoglutarate dehydrogenase, E2 component, dihydrolipoamide succinyltransferase [Actinomycetes bacterium]